MLSLGAGLYEELLFRVLLVSALAAGARAVFGFGVKGAGVFATLVGALIFSAFHYIGPFGDPFSLTSFTFRAISGVAFSALYLLRGFRNHRVDTRSTTHSCSSAELFSSENLLEEVDRADVAGLAEPEERFARVRQGCAHFARSRSASE